jgi:hypothetical protein
MTEEEWMACGDLMAMLNEFPRSFGERKHLLFTCACCYHVRDAIFDVRSRDAIEVAEEFADGLVDGNALAAAQREAEAANREPFDWGARAVVRLCKKAFASSVYEAAKAGWPPNQGEQHAARLAEMIPYLRDIFGNPFRPAAFSPSWRTDTALSLARMMYDSRDFGAMPILADALQDAGCDSEDILNHCRGASSTHVRGCWVLDLVLGKE